MKPIVCHGWQIYFHPIFFEQWQVLRHEVTRLKAKLDTEKFVTHPQVKLLKALDIGIREKIPQNPLASYFALVGPLRKFSRLKKMGLPARYRLFFRVFPEQKTIIILWLGCPRKAVDQRDCYGVFEKLVRSGVFPKTVAELGS
ncbi:MAG: type II toxin-antitoxin system YhaV family toxin [Synechococcus sp.]|nr:type II toxin-antitoxin system YhaV family toxin [Synechococcus sp.]